MDIITQRVVLFGLSAAMAAQTTMAQNYKPGDRVVVIADAKLHTQKDGDVDDVWPGLVLQVGAVNRKWLWLGQDRAGWLDRQHVVPLNRRAIDPLTTLVNTDPRNARTYHGRATVWNALGELDIAIADWNEAIRLDPKDASTYNNRGTSWAAKGEYDKAIADYNEALRLNPKYANAYNGLAWLRATCPKAQFRDGNQAVADATKACELTHWKNDNHVGTLSVAYAELGNFQDAIRWLSKAMEMDAGNYVKLRKKMLKLFKSGKPFRNEEN